MEMDDELHDLAIGAITGEDYDVAKLFIHMFPMASQMSTREISMKLSENLVEVINQVAAIYSKKAMTCEHNQGLNHLHTVKEAEKLSRHLRQHSRKTTYMNEIQVLAPL